MSKHNSNFLIKEKQGIKNSLFSPITISFGGIDAEYHYIDAELFGLSTNGTAKIYNDLSHFIYTGKIPNYKTQRKFRMYTLPPRDGSFTYTMWCIMFFGEMSLYPQLWGDVADFVLPEIIKGIYMRLTNNTTETERIVERLLEDRQKERECQQEIQRMAFSTVLESQKMMHDTINKFADNLRGSVKKSVEPIGRSCNKMSFLKNDNNFLTIDEPMAEVIRSKEKLEVDDMKTYKCLIRGVDTLTGSAKLQLENIDMPILASINDPSLLTIGNIYTNALDNQREVEITAKATLKNGKINKLFVSDAKFNN